MSASDTVARDGDMSLTVLMIVTSQDRSRDFYHRVLGADIVRDRDPVILRFHNGVIVLNVGGGPTSDKPAVTMAPPADQDTVGMALNIRVADIQAVYHDWQARVTAPESGPMAGATQRAVRSTGSAWLARAQDQSPASRLAALR